MKEKETVSKGLSFLNMLTLEEELDLNKSSSLFKLVDYWQSMRALNAFRDTFEPESAIPLKKIKNESTIEDINDKLKSVGLRTCVRDTNKMIRFEITTNRETGATEVKCNGLRVNTDGVESYKIENGPTIIMKPPKCGWVRIDD